MALLPNKAMEVLNTLRVARLAIPLQGGMAAEHEVLLQRIEPTALEVEYSAGDFPRDRVDAAGNWTVFADNGTTLLSLHCQLDTFSGPCRLRLLVEEFSFHSHSRRFHRIDAEVFLTCRYGFRQWPEPGRSVRQKINLSGSGVRFRSEIAFRPGQLLTLEIAFPGRLLETLRCGGKVIRNVRLETGVYEVSLEIVRVDREDHAKVIAFCMAEQFRQMHSRVRVLASLLSPSLSGPGAEEENSPDSES